MSIAVAAVIRICPNVGSRNPINWSTEAAIFLWQLQFCDVEKWFGFLLS